MFPTFWYNHFDIENKSQTNKNINSSIRNVLKRAPLLFCLCDFLQTKTNLQQYNNRFCYKFSVHIYIMFHEAANRKHSYLHKWLKCKNPGVTNAYMDQGEYFAYIVHAGITVGNIFDYSNAIYGSGGTYSTVAENPCVDATPKLWPCSGPDESSIGIWRLGSSSAGTYVYMNLKIK